MMGIQKQVGKGKAGQLQLADLPCLQLACWNRDPESTVTREEALALYTRNWRHIKNIKMNAHEQRVFDDLVEKEGRGIFAV